MHCTKFPWCFKNVRSRLARAECGTRCVNFALRVIEYNCLTMANSILILLLNFATFIFLFPFFFLPRCKFIRSYERKFTNEGIERMESLSCSMSRHHLQFFHLGFRNTLSLRYSLVPLISSADVSVDAGE